MARYFTHNSLGVALGIEKRRRIISVAERVIQFARQYRLWPLRCLGVKYAKQPRYARASPKLRLLPKVKSAAPLCREGLLHRTYAR